MFTTVHSVERAKERIGMNPKAAEHFMRNALERGKDKSMLTIYEADTLLGAAWDLKLKKETTARCPKCGNELELFEKGKFVTVSCKTKGCLSATRKGI